MTSDNVDPAFGRPVPITYNGIVATENAVNPSLTLEGRSDFMDRWIELSTLQRQTGHDGMPFGNKVRFRVGSLESKTFKKTSRTLRGCHPIYHIRTVRMLKQLRKELCANTSPSVIIGDNKVSDVAKEALVSDGPYEPDLMTSMKGSTNNGLAKRMLDIARTPLCPPSLRHNAFDHPFSVNCMMVKAKGNRDAHSSCRRLYAPAVCPPAQG